MPRRAGRVEQPAVNTGAAALVVLLDVDNTLLDNDRFSAALDARLEAVAGPGGRALYRTHYEALRAQSGYADYLAPLQALRHGIVGDAGLLSLSAFMLEYPFADLLYPGALAAIAHLSSFAVPVVLTDGDLVFQPWKVRRSGLWEAVQGRVLLSLHKDSMLDAVERAQPARHYALVDDKPSLLAAAKAVLGPRVTTVFVRQGHYAAAAPDPAWPAPDLAFERIGALAHVHFDQLAPTTPTHRTSA